MTDPRVEVAVDAILKARRWRDMSWGDGAIGGFSYGTEDKPRYVIRDDEAEQEAGKTVVLFSTENRDEYDRELARAYVRREVVAALRAIDAIPNAPTQGGEG